MKLLPLLGLFVCLNASAQAPVLSGLEITGQTQLSSSLSWTAVPNATYNVYRSRHWIPCPVSNSNEWTEIVDSLTTTTYAETPGIGSWCYAVTSQIGAVESPFSNNVAVVLGLHWYAYIYYTLPDCVTRVPTPAGAQLVIQQTLNGVTTNMPVTAQGTDTFWGTSRYYDTATYTATLTLPDGYIISIPNPLWWTVGPLSAAWTSTFRAILIQGTDQWCQFQSFSTFQPATSN
jgi:hypothetical protein